MCDQRHRDIHELFDAFNDIRPEQGAASQAIERTHKAILEHSGRTRATVESWWNIRSRRGLFAAAVVVVAIMASLVLSTAFSPSVATGFAQVREQIDRVRTMTFDVRLESPGTPAVALGQMIRNDGRSRKQYPDGRYVVVERTQQSWTRLEVNPAKKVAQITYGFPQDLPLNLFDSFCDLAESVGASRIEARMIKGQSCPGFLIAKEEDSHNQQMQLWVDPESRLPCYAVVTANVGDNVDDAKATLSNFEYNKELKDSLFALVPPAGYTVTKVGSRPQQRSVPWPTEKLVFTLGEGIGPVKFGMSKEQVIDWFGEPEEKSGPRKRLDSDVHTTETWSYNSQGLDILFMSPPGGVYLVEGTRESPTNRAFRGKTKEGIGLGASPEDVRRAYPDILEEQPINKDGFGLYIYPELRLMVGFVDGVVYNLSIRHVPNKPPASEQVDE